MLYITKKNIQMTFFCLFFNVTEVASVQPGKLGNFILPEVFFRALEQGMTIPVYIRYEKADEKSKQKIADAVIVTVDGMIAVRTITPSELTDNAVLSKKTREDLGKVRDVKFRDNIDLVISDNVRLHMDVSSLHLEMIVSKDALTESVVARSSILGPSSVGSISNVLNYNFGYYYNNYRSGSSTSNYLTLDNTTSLREHHININSSFYGMGDSNSYGRLYRAIYERDYEGYRFALGMLDTWNIQSVASINALNGGEIYGVSYGNKASSVIEDNSVSLTPIVVFLPSPGEIHVFRDGNLLSIQNFNMGSFEVDTRNFPYGVYDVTVDIVINGKVINSRRSRVNKIFSHQQITGFDNFSWQFFGGTIGYDRINYKRDQYHNLGKKQTWVAGGATSMAFHVLSGLRLKSTAYGFDSRLVNESDITFNMNEFISFGNQVLISNDSSWRSISNVNLNFPAGLGALWGTREKSKISRRLFIQESDNYSIGTTINAGQFIPYGGSFTMSQTQDNHSSNKYRNLDYNTILYSGRYATIGLRAGVQRYSYSNVNDNGRQERYVSLDLTLPLAYWLSVGVSRDRYGSTQGNISARKLYDEGVIKSVGMTASTRLSGEKYFNNNYSARGNLSYDTKHNAGTVSLARAADNSGSMNISSQGSLAWAGKNFGLSAERQQSGIIVDTNLKGNAKIAAKINNRNYTLSGKSNFVALPAYSKYKMEIINDKNSEDSFDIISGRKQEFILYPGNVGLISPNLRSIVTVFGRLIYDDNQVAMNTEIYNHIGKTRTGDDGGFAIDIDKKYPVITAVQSSGRICEADLDLEEARGAEWVGDVKCIMQTTTADN